MEAAKSTGGALLRRGREAAGRGLCGIAILLAFPLGAFHLLSWLASLDARSAAPALLGALLGVLAADAVTGLVHWACDTWGDDRTPWLGPSLIHSFREHHRDPLAMLEHDWVEVNREPAIAATVALLIAALPGVRGLLAEHVAVYGFLCFLAVYGAAANQLHAWSHMERPPRLVRGLQRWGLVLTPARHARHHRAPYLGAYCISTGWLNPLLDRADFWRWLERRISRLTGMEARAPVRLDAVE